MLVSEQWLREWVSPQQDSEALVQLLTQCGLEVEGVQSGAPEFSGVVVGHVVACEQHPNADKLRCCQVVLGQSDETVDIVCGAANVRAGLKVPVATVGAVLPGGFKIKKAKLRGEPSHGMICAAQELGLSEEAGQGIMELAEDAPVGQDIRDYLALNDLVFDVALTPNRGDCASMQGIAREVAAAASMLMTPPPLKKQKAQHKTRQRVTIDAPSACTRYVGRVITGINPKAKTPVWMQERLRRCGVRSIHPVVDVTNYVMMELGQPMHAFDLDQLTGDVQVRLSKDGESLSLLDGRTVNLTDNTLVIADAQGPQALAGVMGGAASGVTELTQTIFLESACFDPLFVRRAASHYGVQSDSSYRFERGVDFALQEIAIERASDLLCAIVGGALGPTEVVEATQPTVPTIELRRDQVARVLGVTLDDSVIAGCLKRLSMGIKSTRHGWKVVPPTYRPDLTREIDLIEEVARLYGYDQIPESTQWAPLHMVAPRSSQTRLLQVKTNLVHQGFSELVTYSFVDPALQAALCGSAETLTLANPISSELSEMRVSLWPGLIQTLQRNLNRQVDRHRYFETGVCFAVEGSEHREVSRLGVLLAGPVTAEQWGLKARTADFYDLKGVITHLAAQSGLCEAQTAQSWEPSTHEALHPGQQAAWHVDGRPVGYLGVLHPALVKQLDLSQVPVLFECELTAWDKLRVPQYRPVSKFPAVRRDLAVIVDNSLPVATLLSTFKAECGNILNEITIFDVYSGKGVPEGKKSVALGLTFQDASRTLVDSEIIQRIQEVVAVLERELNATIRE